MPVDIIDCEQGTDEWLRARAGIPTASEFATVMAKGKTPGAESIMRRTYMRKLAGERLTGEPSESYTNVHMERGKIMEDEARSFYAFMRSAEPERIGFVRNGEAGCSPDSFIGLNGMLEIKTALPHIVIEHIIRGDVMPPEHKAQCQGGLWICEREFIDVLVYWPKMPTFIHRAYRDEAYIKALADEIDRFNGELAALVERISKYEPASMKPAVAAGPALTVPTQPAAPNIPEARREDLTQPAD